MGVKFVHTEAVGLTFTDKLTVETLAGDFPADAVILATGASRAAPPVPGLAALEGRGVSYCATCDAFFYRGKDVAVLGSGEYALHEIAALLPLAKSVTLLTGGAELTASFPAQVAVRTQTVEAILGPDKVSGVQLAGGEVLPVDGVFVAMGVAGSNRPGPQDGRPGGGQQDRRGRQDDDHHSRAVCRRGLHRRPAAGGQGSLRRGRGRQ